MLFSGAVVALSSAHLYFKGKPLLGNHVGKKKTHPIRNRQPHCAKSRRRVDPQRFRNSHRMVADYASAQQPPRRRGHLKACVGIQRLHNRRHVRHLQADKVVGGSRSAKVDVELTGQERATWSNACLVVSDRHQQNDFRIVRIEVVANRNAKETLPAGGLAGRIQTADDVDQARPHH